MVMITSDSEACIVFIIMACNVVFFYVGSTSIRRDPGACNNRATPPIKG